MQPHRGEVWLIDFGLAGKVRPALVVNTAFRDRDRALISVIPHTTSTRGSDLEVSVSVPFLKPGAFLVQGITTFPTTHVLRKLETLSAAQFDQVFVRLLKWLGHS